MSEDREVLEQAASIVDKAFKKTEKPSTLEASRDFMKKWKNTIGAAVLSSPFYVISAKFAYYSAKMAARGDRQSTGFAFVGGIVAALETYMGIELVAKAQELDRERAKRKNE